MNSRLRGAARVCFCTATVIATIRNQGAQLATLCGVAILLSLAFVLMTLSKRGERTLRVNWIGWVMLIGVLACSLQLVPLPLNVLSVVSPAAAEIRGSVSHEPPHQAPLSLEPAGTAFALANFLVLFSATWLAPRLFTRSSQRNKLAWTIIVTGVVFLVFSLFDRLPGDAHHMTNLVSVFANANHVAALLGFVAFLAVAVAWKSTGTSRACAIAATVLCGSGVFLSLSRGAIIAFTLCSALCALFALTGGSKRALTVGAAVFLITVALAALIDGEAIVGELQTLDGSGHAEKITVWRDALPILRKFWLTGIGRGAFAAVFAAHDTSFSHLTFFFVENEVLQHVLDFGIAGGAMVALWCASLSRVWIRSDRDSGPFVAVALLFLSVQNIADFNIESLSVALPAVALFSLAIESRDERKRVESRWFTLTTCLVATAVAALLIPSAYYFRQHSLNVDTERARATAASCDRIDLEELVWRHPADYIIPLVMAERLLECRAVPNVTFTLLNHSQLMAPSEAMPHRLTGRALLRVGRREQALSEYAAAISAEPPMTHAVLKEVFAMTGDRGLAVPLAARVPSSRGEIALYMLWIHEPATSLRLLEGGAPLRPSELSIAARAALELGQDDRAHELATRLVAQAPRDASGYVVNASVFARSGDVSSALEALAAGISAKADRKTLLANEFDVLVRARRFDEARSAAYAYLEAASDIRESAQAYSWIGSTHESEKNYADALRGYERARDIAPRDPVYRVFVIRVLGLIGDKPAARRELRRAQMELGAHPLLESAATQLGKE